MLQHDEPIMPLQANDIQGLVRHGYPYFDAAAYLLFHIDDPQGCKSWLAKLLAEPWIDHADLNATFLKRTDCGVSIAFTAPGLRQLGLDDEALQTFVSEFQEGMVAPARSRRLGDERDSHPDKWDWGKAQRVRGENTIDGLLIVFAGYPPKEELEKMEKAQGKPANEFDPIQLWLEDRVAEVRRLPGCPRLVYALNGRLNIEQGSGVSREPFGFADGISQPYVRGLTRKDRPRGAQIIEPGEFVLGYPNQVGRFSASPSVDAAADPSKLLPRLPPAGRADFGRNGTFLVMRQLEQDVEKFSAFTRGDECMAARMVGRFRSGAPLVRHRADVLLTQDDLEEQNDFRYHHEDRAGFLCPIGAHIRRTNPRDSLADGLGITPKLAQELVDQHRILRRGRAYRQEDGTQGLVFICLNTNIERQFEFVQGSWLMHPEFGGLRGETDPLLGYAPDDGQRSMTLQRPLLNQRLDGLRRFVTVRGGAYFFLPGLRALDYLSRV